MKSLFLALVFFIVSNSLIAQQAITGRVMDENGQPMEYANVVLLHSNDSLFIAGTISDLQGEFLLNLPSPLTSCLIQVSSVGYQTYCQPADCTAAMCIVLKNDSQLLSEVIIKGELPVTRLKGDALVTNVAGSLLEKVGTAEEVLSKIPGILAENGALTVFGRGTPIIYLNGKLVRDKSELDQLASDNIQAVEVITNPGARYDASVKAVIRIRTKKAMGDGFGFNNRAFAKHNKEWSYLEQFDFNYRKGEFNLIGTASYNYDYSWRNYRAEQTTYLDKTWVQKMETEQQIKQKQLTGNLAFNYLFHPNHSIGASYRYNRQPGRNSYGTYLTDVYQDNLFYENSFSEGPGKEQFTQHLINFYYNGQVGEWNIDFNADMLHKKEDVNTYEYEKITNETEGDEEVEVTTITENRNQFYAGKLILSHPLLGGNFSLGTEYSYTKRISSFFNREGILLNDESKIEENSFSLFAEYGIQIGRAGLQAGLRFENSVYDYYKEGVRQDEQSKKYNHIFPSLSLTVPLGRIQTQLSYTENISRPSYQRLRNWTEYINRYMYESGNPYLQPSTTRNLAFTAVYRWLRFYADYQHIMDDFITTSTIYDDDPTIALFTVENSKSYDRMNLLLTASPTLSFWSPQFSAGIRKQWYKADTPDETQRLNRPEYIARWQNGIKLPKGILLNADIAWTGKSNRQNLLISPWWGIDMSIYKEFLKDRLTLLIQGNDLFKNRRYQALHYNGFYHTMEMKTAANMRSFSFTLRYKFNSSGSKYKGTGAGENQKQRL